MKLKKVNAEGDDYDAANGRVGSVLWSGDEPLPLLAKLPPNARRLQLRSEIIQWHRPHIVYLAPLLPLSPPLQIPALLMELAGLLRVRLLFWTFSFSNNTNQTIQQIDGK